ncbi:MAG: hypothetical protein IT381_21950 [Deltaproteobacteria bacterium]|nr:hypothetical protein [Deltaproteobacteria bacterium]
MIAVAVLSCTLASTSTWSTPVRAEPSTQPAATPTATAAPPAPAPVPRLALPRRPWRYEGGAVPPGAHLEMKPQRGLASAGGIVFGILHVAMLVAVAVEPGTWPLAIPVAGPIAFGAMVAGGPDLWVTAAFVGVGVIQGGALAMLITGLVMKRPYVVPDALGGVRFSVLPAAGGADVGLSLRVDGFSF